MEKQIDFLWLINAAGVPCQVLDENKRLVDVNNEWRRQYGYEIENAIGKSFEDFLPAGSRTEFNKFFSRQKSVNSKESCVLEIICRNGRKRPIELSASTETDNNGSFIRMVCVFKDFIGSKDTACELPYSDIITNVLMDIPSSIIIIVDKNGSIIDVNKKFADRIGVSQSALIGCKIASLFPKEVSREKNNVFQTAKESQQPIRFEFERNGEWFDTTVHPLLDEHGEVHTIVIHSHDITQSKHVDETLRQLQEKEKLALVGQAAGRMAHDVNNALGIIMGTGHLLKSDDLPPEVLERIEVIIQASLNGRYLTSEMIRVARDNNPHFELLDLNERINMVMKSMQHALKSIDLEIRVGSNMRLLQADRGLLDNALINMIQNSIHAMSLTARPLLSIRTFEKNDHICLEIEDNGCGIPEEYIDTIYDPTVSLKGPDDVRGDYRDDVKGNGFGMFNVKRFVDKHMGTITCKSTPGKGTTFRILLPIFE